MGIIGYCSKPGEIGRPSPFHKKMIVSLKLEEEIEASVGRRYPVAVSLPVSDWPMLKQGFLFMLFKLSLGEAIQPISH
jgi:hypothetical protein